jgi:hypothetical protein
MVTEKIEIHFDADEGHLWIDCDGAEFARMRNLVLAEAEATDRVGPFLDGLRSILIRHPATPREVASVRPGRRVRVVLIAAALASSLAIQVFGLVVLARRLLGLDP